MTLDPTDPFFEGALRNIIQQELDASALAVTTRSVGPKTGDIKWKATSVTDAGWLAADGSGVTSAHADLRADLISAGSPHGTDGSGNPKLPNLRDRVPVGAGTSYSLGATFGEATHVLTGRESGIQEHVHQYPAGTTGFLATGASNPWSVGAGGGALSIQNATGGVGYYNAQDAHENRQPSVALFAFVKT